MQLFEIELEVMALHKKILSACADSGMAAGLYQGIHLYTSQVRLHPDIVLLGYNPRWRYPPINQQPLCIVDQYSVREQRMLNRKTFMSALFESLHTYDVMEALFDAVCINCYPFIADTPGHIEELLLGLKENVDPDLERKLSDMLYALIGAFHPRLIICKTRRAFDHLAGCFAVQEVICSDLGTRLYTVLDDVTVVFFPRSESGHFCAPDEIDQVLAKLVISAI